MKPSALLPLLGNGDWWWFTLSDEESSFSEPDSSSSSEEESSFSEPDSSSSSAEESSFSEPDSSSSSPTPEPEPEPDSSSSSSSSEDSSAPEPEPESDSSSSSSSESSELPSLSCSVDLHEYGRKQIGVNQGSAGAYYPFISPSDNLQYLIADLFLHYIDDKGIFEPPFKIDWLVGFGCLPNISPVGITNEYDVQISDANDQIVFNSQFASTFLTSDWNDPDGNPYLKILEWTNSDNEVLRIVIFTAWEDSDEVINWYYYFEPTDAQLDSRATEQKPRELRYLAVDSTIGEIDIPGSSNVILKAGYNLQFTLGELEDDDLVDGGIVERVIDVDVDPGLGLGRFPACEDVNTIKTINNISPNERGNFIFDVSECYRLEVPITNITDTADLTASTLKFTNDCSPCCDCEEYRRIYEAIRRLDTTYRSLGVRAVAVKDQYKINRERWEEQVKCRKANRIRTAIQTTEGCLAGIAAGVCNLAPQEPLSDVEVRISFTYNEGGVEAATTLEGCLVCGSVLRKGNTDPYKNSGSNKLLPYTLVGDWPVYKAYFDCIHPSNVGYVTFLLQFSNCDSTDTLEMVVEVFNSQGTRIYGPVKESASLIDTYTEPDCCSLGAD